MFDIFGHKLTCDETKIFFKLLKVLDEKEVKIDNILVLKALISYFEKENIA